METTAFILERKPSYTDHDRLFKEVIQVFFQDFMEAFFPEVYEHINFSTVSFLDQEVFTDILKGEKRRIDILAEVKIKGEDTIILIHVEPQSYYQEEFHERMFIYNTRLYEKYRKPILPIAVFSYNDTKELPTQFSIDLPTIRIIDFHFQQLHLINKNWRKYIKMTNPIVAAFLSKMNYTEKERIQVKLEFLRMVSRMELDPAKMELIYGFFETYLKLNEKEEKQMHEEINKLPREEADRVLELPNTYRDQGRAEGIAQGIEKGRAQEREQIALNLLKKGMSDEEIANIIGIAVSRVREWRKELQ
ncbi:Rpn family recombination-promoting nuclease/putative transposase [Oceanobacillus indicireducens]|uniref:Transposase n=1 Tax=Oceanobacillus indicireducens TaxID=1004261 RepID=A0A917Y2T1_9BACI|nr:Rpn family recombination-promoting nuclease/putative transposase [Oceanobacillus indicireducens]GGN65536.1 transposase [Oceanobacillus indicireducens]